MEQGRTPHPACIIDNQKAGMCEFVGCPIKMTLEVLPGANAPFLYPNAQASFCMSRCLADFEQHAEDNTGPGQQSQ